MSIYYARWTKSKGGLAGAIYGVSKHGWMEEGSKFYEWFKKQFVPSVAPLLRTGPIVLFVDGHHSHLGLELIRICFPPHLRRYRLTHILLPLDVEVYGPVKTTWKPILKEHKLSTCAQNVTKEDFPGH